MSNSLQPHELQHARPPCPSPTPGVHPNSCPLSQWCHPTISSSVIPFSSCPQSFPKSESFQMSEFFASGGQSIRVSASTSVLPMNTQDWSPLDGLVGSPCSPRDSKTLLQHHSSKASIFWCSAFFTVQLSYPYTTTGKTIALTWQTFVGKVMSLLFFFFLICSEFCHTLKWNGLEFTCLPHPDPPSHLTLHPLPPGLPRAPGPSACLMHPTWAGDLFHPW